MRPKKTGFVHVTIQTSKDDFSIRKQVGLVNLCIINNVNVGVYMSCVMRNRLFACAKTKTQISFALIVKLIRTFVFAT